ncbi:MAG: THUMP domain-containing protein, partial [Armatimonadota bacterium]|nr:THUMP domain-containing protein [Armatimonadota bacterium]
MFRPPAGEPVYFASLIAGLEFIVADELGERMPQATVLGASRGKVFFAAPGDPSAGLDLLTIENLFAYVEQLQGISAGEDGLEVIRRRVAGLDLGSALATYHRLHGRAGRPTFRITAKRSGTHEYTSMDVAAAAGAGVQERYGWDVDLEDYDYDVRVYLTDDVALVGLRLSPEPLHRRGRIEHGAASLNPTVAQAMCRLANPQPGELFMDPMCGAGTILLERARIGGAALLVGGDLFAEPLAKAAENLQADGVGATLLQWDARHLPLRSGCVSRAVCNLPWGRRIGSHRVNRHLYPGFVRELARVLRPSGRAVLLTQEKRLITRLVDRNRRLRFGEQHTLSLSGMHPT